MISDRRNMPVQLTVRPRPLACGPGSHAKSVLTGTQGAKGRETGTGRPMTWPAPLPPCGLGTLLGHARCLGSIKLLLQLSVEKDNPLFKHIPGTSNNNKGHLRNTLPWRRRVRENQPKHESVQPAQDINIAWSCGYSHCYDSAGTDNCEGASTASALNLLSF